jgi:opacity protein-like surface antigen
VNPVDFSLNLGFSFNVKENLTLDLRYNRGFSKVYEFDGELRDVDDEDYNSVIQLGASYSF